MRLNKRTLITLLFVILAITYVVLLIVIPPEARTLNKYNLTKEQARNLNLSVAVPYIAIWLTGLYGYLRLDAYTEKIKASPDGSAFSKLTRGLLILALTLPISAIIGNVDLYITNKHDNFLATGTIINNYVNLVLALVAFWFIFRGAKQLYQLLPKFKIQTSDGGFLPALFALASTWYSYFTLTNPARQHPTALARTATYYLSDWLLVVTIILPYIIMLYFGFSSVGYLLIYMRHVPGIIYKRALRYIANGLSLIHI